MMMNSLAQAPIIIMNKIPAKNIHATKKISLWNCERATWIILGVYFLSGSSFVYLFVICHMTEVWTRQGDKVTPYLSEFCCWRWWLVISPPDGEVSPAVFLSCIFCFSPSTPEASEKVHRCMLLFFSPCGYLIWRKINKWIHCDFHQMTQI